MNSSGSPANALRESLEVKYRHAASRGKTFVGDDELLLPLYELASEPGCPGVRSFCGQELLRLRDSLDAGARGSRDHV